MEIPRITRLLNRVLDAYRVLDGLESKDIRAEVKKALFDFRSPLTIDNLEADRIWESGAFNCKEVLGYDLEPNELTQMEYLLNQPLFTETSQWRFNQKVWLAKNSPTIASVTCNELGREVQDADFQNPGAGLRVKPVVINRFMLAGTPTGWQYAPPEAVLFPQASLLSLQIDRNLATVCPKPQEDLMQLGTRLARQIERYGYVVTVEQNTAAEASGIGPQVLITVDKRMVQGVRNSFPVIGPGPRQRDYVKFDKSTWDVAPKELEVLGKTVTIKQEGDYYIAKSLRFPPGNDLIAATAILENGIECPIIIQVETIY